MSSAPPVRRLLMIVYQFPPYGSIGGSIRATKFAKYLPDFGWEPSVLTIRVSENDYVRKDSASLLAEVSPSMRVVRVPAIHPPQFLVRLLRGSASKPTLNGAPPRFSWPKDLARWTLRAVQQFVEKYLLTYDVLILWVPIALWHIRKELKRSAYDALFVTLPPRSMVLVAWLAKRLFKKPVLLDVRDDWVDSPSFLRKSRLQQAIGRWVERRTVCDVDCVAVVSPLSEADFRRRYPAHGEKIRMIPNGCDLAELETVSKLIRCEAGDRLRVVHAGVVMPPGRDPRPFFEALARLRERNPDAYAAMDVLFIGSLPLESRRALDTWNLRGIVHTTDFLPRHEFWATIRNADVLLTIGDHAFPSMVPGKIYDYWAARRPQLYIGPKGAASAMVTDYRLGWVAPYDVEAILACIERIFGLWKEQALDDVSLDGIAQFDRRHLTEQLATALSRMVAG